MLKIFKTKNIFVACFSTYKEEDIADSSDRSSATVANITVEDIAYMLGARDRGGVFTFLWHGSGLTT